MVRSPVSQPWLVRPRPNPRAAMRLFCFPYAGGGASVFSKWASILPEAIELCCVQLPGRETRMFETPYKSLPTLIEALAPVLTQYMERPFAFFGHSMGALISFELSRHLRKSGQALPSGLFVSGRRAPHIPEDEDPVHDLPTPEFIQELRELNGTPAAILEDMELMELALPGLRADFQICETYAYTQEASLNLPILAFGGLSDPDVSRQDMDAWREHTTGRFSLSMLPGDHFFIHSAYLQILQRLSQELFRLENSSFR